MANPQPSRRLVPVHLGWLVALLLAVAITWFAAWAVLRPAAEEPAPAAPATVTVERGMSGRSVTVQGVLSFDVAFTARAGEQGVVTQIGLAPGAGVAAGEPILTVNERPVTAIPGAVPAYRNLRADDRGADVAQLRAHFGLPEGDLFDYDLVLAIRQFQSDHGMRVDGEVQLGDFVFVPELPARARIAQGIAVGAGVSQGDALVEFLGTRPETRIGALENSLVAPGMAATIVLPSGNEVQGVVSEPETSAEGSVEYRILAEDGQPACDAECASEFSSAGRSQVQVRVEIVPEQEGLVVPVSAVVSDASGRSVVQTPEGERIPVDIVAHGEGVMLVEGVEEGARVLLFAEES